MIKFWPFWRSLGTGIFQSSSKYLVMMLYNTKVSHVWTRINERMSWKESAISNRWLTLAYMARIRQNLSTYQDLWAIYANVNKHFGPFATQYFTNLTWTTTLSYVTFQIRMPRSPSNTSVVYLFINMTSVVELEGAELIWCRFTKMHQSSPSLISLKRILSSKTKVVM